MPVCQPQRPYRSLLQCSLVGLAEQHWTKIVVHSFLAWKKRRREKEKESDGWRREPIIMAWNNISPTLRYCTYKLCVWLIGVRDFWRITIKKKAATERNIEEKAVIDRKLYGIWIRKTRRIYSSCGSLATEKCMQSKMKMSNGPLRVGPLLSSIGFFNPIFFFSIFAVVIFTTSYFSLSYLWFLMFMVQMHAIVFR